MNVSKLLRTLRLYFQEIDRPLFFTVLAISIFSLVNMYGISGGGDNLFGKQVILVAIGLSIMIILSFFNYRYLKNYSLPVTLLYTLSLFLLALTFVSRSIRGTNAWLTFGGFTFEPAELTKLCLIVLMAKYFSKKHVYIYQFSHVVAASLYFVVPAILIIKQPDLGSATILSFIWFSLLIAAGMNKKHFLIIFLLAIVLVCVSWLFILKPYQKVRVISFLDQGQDPRGSGYNLIQSKIAIGSGFWFGKGLGKGSQANLGFLPEPHNDFIFAAMAEQFGMAGVFLITGLMLFLLYRVMSVGSAAFSNFSKLFCVGIAVFIFSHLFVSIGVNIGLLPVTGLPFPFLSSGGSNFFSIMAGLGVVQSMRRFS